jgi:ABC-type multidrug transport system ATPase subunit
METPDNLIESCDLSSKKTARAGSLSGGQKRKLQLACMLVGGSSLCLLDEVTSGLVSSQAFRFVSSGLLIRLGSIVPSRYLEYYSCRTD